MNDTTVIGGLITLIGIAIVNVLQFLNTRKKTSSDLVNQLLEQALKLNKQELETIRGLNEELEKKVERLNLRLDLKDTEIEKLKERVSMLELEKFNLQRELDNCVKKE